MTPLWAYYPPKQEEVEWIMSLLYLQPEDFILSPERGFHEWAQGVQTSWCCSDTNRKMLILIIKTVLRKKGLCIKPACDIGYSHLSTWIKRNKGSSLSTWISVKASLRWIPHGHYGSSSELGHISITFIFHACAWVCTDPAYPLGSLIIRAVRPECWLRGCTELCGRKEGQIQGLFFSDWKMLLWPLLPIQEDKTKSEGSPCDGNLYHRNIHTAL